MLNTFMFCISSMKWKVKGSLNRLIKIGFTFGMSFSLINGMEYKKDNANNCAKMIYKRGDKNTIKVFGGEFVGNNACNFNMC